MNALEFLIANADAVLDHFRKRVDGKTFRENELFPSGDKKTDPVGQRCTYNTTDVIVNQRVDNVVTVSFCRREARRLTVESFVQPRLVGHMTAAGKADLVSQFYRVNWFSIELGSRLISPDSICIAVHDFKKLVDKYREGKAPEHAIRRKYTSAHDTSEATFEIRKSVLLKEAGGSTAEEGNVSLAEPRKNSFRASYFLSKNYATAEAIRRVIDRANAIRPAGISITIQKPGMQDGEYSRRIRIHGTAKIEHFTPEQIAASQNTNSKSATAWGALLSKWSAGDRWAAAPYDKMAEELKDAPYQSTSAQLLYKVLADIIAAQNPRVDISTTVNWPELANQQTKIMQDIKDSHHRNLSHKELDQAPATVKEVIDYADKQYSEEHAKQLASLDALIASTSMPDACKTLLRGCRHQFERADTYDQLGGERSMDKIVPMFNILYGKDLTKEQGWMFMMLVKAVRSANGKYSADSYEDGGSYWGLADEDAKKERK